MIYTGLNLIFFALLILVVLTAKPKMNWKAVGLGLIVVCSLTAVFDPIMIAVGLVEYDSTKLSGLYWFGAPIEDIAYALFAVPFVASVWQMLERAK